MTSQIAIQTTATVAAVSNVKMGSTLPALDQAIVPNANHTVPNALTIAHVQNVIQEDTDQSASSIVEVHVAAVCRHHNVQNAFQDDTDQTARPTVL